MLKFKQFISEAAVITQSKLDDEHGRPGHQKKYLDPHARDKIDSDSPLQLEKPHEDHPAGTKVTYTGNYKDTTKKNGKRERHAEVHMHDTGEKKLIPVQKIRKPSNKIGTYSDEHAIRKMWNHSAENKQHDAHVAHLKTEIEKSKDDPKHPLNIKHADPSTFTASDKDNPSAHDSYYDRLHAAAHVVHHMVHGSRGKAHSGLFAKEHEEKQKMEVQGATVAKLNKKAIANGMKQGLAGTKKGDTIILGNKASGRKSISVKHSGGAQIGSDLHDGTRHNLRQSLDTLHKNGIINSEQHAKHNVTVDAIHAHMKNENHVEADKLLQHMTNSPEFKHGRNNHLSTELAYEGATGRSKFNRPNRAVDGERQPGVATHMVTIPIRGGNHSKVKNPHGETLVQHISRKMIERKLHIPAGQKGKGMIQAPAIAKGKSGKPGSNPASMRIGGATNQAHFSKKETPKAGNH